jgi:hypothetical protein
MRYSAIIWSITSPGRKRTIEKTSTLTPNSVGIINSRRRMK